MTSVNPASDLLWSDFQAPLFGIGNLTLPGQYDIKPSLDEESAYKLTTPLGDYHAQLTIKLLFDSKLVQRELAAMRSFCDVSPSDELTTVVRTPHVADYGIPVGDSAATTSAVHVKPFGDIAPEVTYSTVAHSPYDHGVLFDLRGPLESNEQLNDLNTRIISSLRWADRKTVARDITSRFIGAWYTEQPLPPYLSKPGHHSTRTLTTTYLPDKRFTATAAITHTPNYKGPRTEEPPTAVPGGTYKVFQNTGDESVGQLLTVSDENGHVTVRNFTLASADMIEFGLGEEYMHRVKKAQKQSLLTRATRKLFR